MATTKADSDAIQAAVERAGVKRLVEPSQQSPVQRPYAHLRELVRGGAPGDPYRFSFVRMRPGHDDGVLGHDSHGAAAFLTREPGGMPYDCACGPSRIVSVPGACKSVMAMSALQVPERPIMPERDDTAYLSHATDPWDANHSDAVVDAPKTDGAVMESHDTSHIHFEMVSGWIGIFHVSRPVRPIREGMRSGAMEAFGMEADISLDPRPGFRAAVSSTDRAGLNVPGPDGWKWIRKGATRRTPNDTSRRLADSTFATSRVACAATRSSTTRRSSSTGTGAPPARHAADPRRLRRRGRGRPRPRPPRPVAARAVDVHADAAETVARGDRDAEMIASAPHIRAPWSAAARAGDDWLSFRFHAPVRRSVEMMRADALGRPMLLDAAYLSSTGCPSATAGTGTRSGAAASSTRTRAT